jgi:hypothetical protein
MKSTPTFNNRQIAFKELFVGTLIYVLVLGFFNDYSDIVYATSFSVMFFASIVLEILTFFALLLKKHIVNWLKAKNGTSYKIMMFFSVWLIMFVSKFVFVGVIDFIFENYVNISGFFGILAVVVSVTLIHKVADYIFIKLGSTN